MQGIKHKVVFFGLLLLLPLRLLADLDQQRPEGVSDKKWNGLKAVIQEVKLTPDDAAANDEFGVAVSLSGNRALVGASYDETTAGNQTGSAYVFEYDGVSWLQTAQLTANDAAAFDRFGNAVSLSGDRALVGAYYDETTAGNQTGSAYVFEYDGVSWSQTAQLTANDAAASDRFGNAVSLSGERALVGAYLDETTAGNQTGSAYVFEYDGVSWSETAKLTANDAAASDRFGNAVSLSGDRALVGAYLDDTVAGNYTGSAYVFDYDGMNWSQTAKLIADDAATNDRFGIAVSLSGDRALVGAFLNNTVTGNYTGSAYVFDFDGLSWSQTVQLTADDAAADDRFGNAVSLSGNRALVGAFYDGTAAGNQSGSAYVFDYDGMSWSQTGRLTADDTALGDRFGHAVSLSGDRVLVGAIFHDAVGDRSGSAYVFDLNAYHVNVAINGLAATNSVSFSNGGDTLTFNTNDTLTLSTLSDGTAFDVDITMQPDTPNQLCDFDNADSGILNGADYTVNVTCVTTQYSVGGTVSGLAMGASVILQNNGVDDLLLSGNGVFTFPSTLDDESNYAVTVLIQPESPNQTCGVAGGGNLDGTGTLFGDDDSSIVITCVTQQYTVGGTLTGLAAGNSVTLQNNGGDDLLLSSDGVFTFATPLNDLSAYDVSVSTQPASPSQTCVVSAASGILSGADVTSVVVNCATDSFTVGGTLTGLAAGNSVTLQNNGGDDLLLSSDGVFTFATTLNDLSAYDVSVSMQPAGQNCTINNGNGTLTDANINDVTVSCSDLSLQLSSSTLDFGQLLQDTVGVASITVSNNGTAVVTIGAVVAPAAPFSLSAGSCLLVPVVLNPGQSCTLEIQLQSDTIGDYADQLVIISDAANSPGVVSLQGSIVGEPTQVPTLGFYGLMLLILLVIALSSGKIRSMVINGYS